MKMIAFKSIHTFVLRQNSTVRVFLQTLPIGLFKLPNNYASLKRNLLTIAIETSCDDTSVAVLEKHANNSASLYFNSKITSDNRSYGGIHPLAAHESHQKNLAELLRLALQKFPEVNEPECLSSRYTMQVGYRYLQKPDFVSVTRGPGMRANLITGIDTAKGLAVGLQIPLIGVNHMQAHALTPRLLSALVTPKEKMEDFNVEIVPKFPFLSLLVSGGHTMLAHSSSIYNHAILANTNDVSLGDMLDKSARAILPTSFISNLTDVMYGRVLEDFTYPTHDVEYNYTPPKSSPIARDGSKDGYLWKITPPYSYLGQEGVRRYSKEFSFSGIGSRATKIMEECPDMSEDERKCLAKTIMTVAFEHLGSRVLFALKHRNLSNIKVLVLSGGVACNRLLRKVLRDLLDTHGFSHIDIVVPPTELCTDNAAMIAWTGLEMFEAGYSTNLHATALKEWSIDPMSDDGGILGVDGWVKNREPVLMKTFV